MPATKHTGRSALKSAASSAILSLGIMAATTAAHAEDAPKMKDPADPFGALEAQVAALACRPGVAQVPQHQRDIGQRTDLGVALRLVDVVGALRSLVAGERILEVLAGEVGQGRALPLAQIDESNVGQLGVAWRHKQADPAILAELGRDPLHQRQRRWEVRAVLDVQHLDHRARSVVLQGRRHAPPSRAPGGDDQARTLAQRSNR